jgi:hypothetical protein
MAVGAGDVPVFILIAVTATAAKTLEGAAFVWRFCAARWGPVIALILAERALGLAGVCANFEGGCRSICGGHPRRYLIVKALPSYPTGNLLYLMNLILRLLSGG